MAEQQDQQQGRTQTSGGMAALTCEKFAGVNTATTRAGVQDEQAYWIDGFMYLAPRNLRTLYGIGTPIYTAAGGTTIICFYFYNLGPIPYAIVFLSDGSAIQVNTSTGVTTTVLSSGTIISPGITSIGVTQYGSQYLIIVANQANGYWVWDGNLLYTAGSLAPQLVVTAGGSAYISPPVVTFSGGHGSGAQAQAQISNGVVTNVVLINPGTGYEAGDEPIIALSGGNRAGSGATVTAVMTTNTGGSGGSISVGFGFVRQVGSLFLYEISGVTIPAAGSGYSQYAQATWVYNAATGSFVSNGTLTTPAIGLTISGGSLVLPVGISPPVDGDADLTYWQTVNFGQLPTVALSDSGGAYISSVTVNSVGSNYSPSTSITATGGNTPISQAVLKPVISNGSISSVAIQSPGLYTGASPAPTLTVTDIAQNATVTCTIMPYGVDGTAVENYQGHVWVFNGNVFNFSAPGSISDFSTSNGGGSDQSTNSYLKVGYVQAVSTNGFLFIIGDSSMDYISGVQTTTPSGGNPTTTFTQNNCDPEIGTPYPAAVTTLGQNILAANPTGIFVSSGGEFVKQSEALDGVYNTVPATQFNNNPFNGFQISAAKATIFGKRVWMVLVPIVDPVSNNTVNKLLMFNGKLWWTSEQDTTLVFIQGQEINSVYTAWGTDGTHLYPLFNTPSTGFTKTLQTKLWDDPGGYESNKANTRFWAVLDYFNTSSPTLTADINAIGIDNSGNQFSNTQSYTISGPTVTGYFVTLPEAIGQQGVFTGMTIKTNAADVAIVSIKADAGNVQYRG